jgi:hypothetical protein
MNPSHVVVDTTDGYVWAKDQFGHLFDADTAKQFAQMRNDGEKIPGMYKVFRLEEES